MIRKACLEDKESIYHLWKELFAHDDNGYTDYYFENLFDCENTYVKEENGEIISTLQRNSHILMFNDLPIKTSMILGVATRPDKQNQGHMHALMRQALEDAEKEEMITLIQAYDPNIYRPFGFHMEYYRNRTTYHRNQIPVYADLKVDDILTAEELCEVYTEFTKRFNGYYVRDKKYFEKYFNEVKAEGGTIVAYRNKDTNKVEGYMVYYLEKFICDIKEIIYLNSWAFLAMMGYAATTRIKVSVHTSDSEQVLKLLPGGDVQTYPFCMARINDYSIFNICYSTAIQNVDEAFKTSRKPLFLHEYA